MTPADISIIFFVVVISAVDIAFVVLGTPTISRRMKDLAPRLSFLPYAWGALGGHFFGWVDDFIIPWQIALVLIAATGALFSFANWFLRPLPKWMPAIYFAAGFVLGVYLIPV